MSVVCGCVMVVFRRGGDSGCTLGCVGAWALRRAARLMLRVTDWPQASRLVQLSRAEAVLGDTVLCLCCAAQKCKKRPRASCRW